MSDTKVMATAPGFYGEAYRKVGDVFLIEEGDFSDLWMKKEAAAPVQSHRPEDEKAYRENATAAIEDLGNALAGNPEAAGGEMSDDDFATYYEQVMGKKPRAGTSRETLQKQVDDKLNAD